MLTAHSSPQYNRYVHGYTMVRGYAKTEISNHTGIVGHAHAVRTGIGPA